MQIAVPSPSFNAAGIFFNNPQTTMALLPIIAVAANRQLLGPKIVFCSVLLFCFFPSFTLNRFFACLTHCFFDTEGL